MGIIFILLGALMTFAGAKFLFYLVAVCIAFFVTIAFYLFFSNLFFGPSTEIGLKVFVLILALAFGGTAAYFGYKFTRAWAIAIVAAGAGVMAFKLLLSLCGVMNNYVECVYFLAGAVIGALIGKKFNNFVRTIGTAFIGSYILMRGFGFIFDGFPNTIDDLKANNMIVYYFISFIVFFVAGSIV